MANLNFILKEEDWYESQPVQLSTGKFAISINFGDAANNRVVVYKSSNGKDYVPYKTALSVGEFCDMNVEGLITGQYVMVGCNELPISSSFWRVLIVAAMRINRIFWQKADVLNWQNPNWNSP